MAPRGPFRPIPNTTQLVIYGANANDNRPVVHVIHAGNNGAPTVGQIAGQAGAVVTAFTANRAAWPTDVTYTDVVATDLNTAFGPQQTAVFGGGGVAGTATPDLPGATFVTEFFTAQRGRSHTGRVMMPANADSLVHSTGIISNAGILEQQTLWSAVSVALEALVPAFGIVVASRKLQVSTVVTSIVCRPKAGNIRRRVFG